MEEITKENYATNHDYMSYSRVSRFMKCEASAAAGYHEPTSTSQLVGLYVDAYFSGEIEEFKEKHPEIFNSRTGALKADFTKANDLITRIENDETFMYYLSGEKQKIMAGEIDGIPFKIKMDSYKEGEFIADLKVMKDFAKVWSDTFNAYTNFVEAYDYDIEMAIFQEVVRQNTGKQLPCYLPTITKESPSDIGIFQIPQETLDKALGVVKRRLPRIMDILDGKIAPDRCEKCSYCKQSKKAKVLDYTLIGLSGDKLRENGIECSDPKLIKEEGEK